MEKKELAQKLKSTVKEKGNRFWLMIFVVTSTLLILVFWAYDIKNTYSGGASWRKDAKDLGISDAKDEAGDTMSGLMALFDKIKEEDVASTSEEVSTEISSTSAVLDKEEIEKLKGMLDDKIQKASSSDDVSSSSVPSLYPELDDSEKTIQDLKKKIAELEGRLD
jgi:hypothetical protein